LDGSKVELFAPCTKSIRAAVLVPVRGEPLAMTPSEEPAGARVTFVLTAGALPGRADGTNAIPVVRVPRGLFRFSLQVTDADGLKNPEPRATYRLRILEDGPPSAAIAFPKGERTSVPFAKWTVRYRMTDDYGISRAWLYWRVFRGTAEATDEADALPALIEEQSELGRTEIEIGAAQSLVQDRTVLDMTETKAEAGDTVHVWLSVADGRLQGEVPLEAGHLPGLARSSPVQFTVVEESEKMREVQQRLTGVEENIDDIREDQRRVRSFVEQIKERIE
jgi:hypothetical protein